MAIAQNNEENVARFGRGLFNAIELVGTKEYSAIDKTVTLMYLTNGRRMNQYDDAFELS